MRTLKLHSFARPVGVDPAGSDQAAARRPKLGYRCRNVSLNCAWFGQKQALAYLSTAVHHSERERPPQLSRRLRMPGGLVCHFDLLLPEAALPHAPAVSFNGL